jgi:hypothetical protein
LHVHHPCRKKQTTQGEEAHDGIGTVLLLLVPCRHPPPTIAQTNNSSPEIIKSYFYNFPKVMICCFFIGRRKKINYLKSRARCGIMPTPEVEIMRCVLVSIMMK